MKSAEQLKKLKQKLSINKMAKEQQKKVVIYIFVVAIAVLVIGSILMPTKHHAQSKPKSVPDMTGVTTSDFTASESASALTKEETQIASLQHTIKQMSDSMQSLQRALNTNTTVSQTKIQQLRAQLGALQTTTQKKMQNQPYGNGSFGNPESTVHGIATTTFNYPGDKHDKNKTWRNYVTPGTFARAVALNGADTNAGVSGQTDTLPITLRILSRGTLPNGKHTSLKGCFVTASAYGNASSERGEIRLQHLSCIKSDGHVLSIPVEGYLTDQGGTDGIRGHVVMRNGKLLFNAGVSGFLSGIGSAMQQSLTTQSVSPLGATSSVPPNKVLEYGAYGGANTALGKLADYYIKLADLYHPIIQLHAGSMVNIVFLKGFSTDSGQIIEKNAPTGVKTTVNNFLPQNLINQLKTAKLGQTVNGGGL